MESIQTQRCPQGLDSLLAVNTSPEKRRHIMVVDDEFSNRLILRNILLKKYEVYEFGNGREALDAISRCKPDLILLDVMMPLMNGYEFCRTVKEDPQTAAIPILFITLMADTSQVVKAFDLGAADYLTKPFYGEEVLARIRRQFLIEEQRESLLQHSKKLEQLVTKETQELIRAGHHIAYGHLVQGIIHNLQNPSLVLTRGVERARESYAKLAESYELGADLNSDLMEIHLRSIDRALNLVDNASERLAGIVVSLLHRSSNNQNQNAQLLDMNTVVRNEVKFLEANPFFANQVEKKLLLSGEALPIVGVPSELAQLFDNLLSNAIDALHQKEKGAVITVETRRVGTCAEITINDNGCGISREDQQHVFTPFFSTKNRTIKDDEHLGLGDLSGTGLGLFMCHNTVQSMRGEIAVKSKLGQGTTFYITIPLAIQEEPYEVQ